MVHCLNLYRSLWGLHWLSGLMAIYQAVCVVLFDAQKLKKVLAITCGYFDGMFGRLGTFEHLHPEIAAFCNNFECKQIPGNSSSFLVTKNKA
jgi:rhamnosyltransferase